MRLVQVPRALWCAALALLGASAAQASRGGPDGGGWSWADSNEGGISTGVDTPASWTTIAAPLPANSVHRVGLSFPFTLYDVTSSTVWVSSNGWMSLLDPGTQSAPVNPVIPSTSVPNATVAYLWDDLGGASSATSIRYGSTPNGDVIQVKHWHPLTANFVVVTIELYRNGSMKVVWAYQPDLSSVTIGIENGGGTAGTQLVHDGVTVPGLNFTAPYAVQFYPRVTPPDCAAAAGPLLCNGPVAGSTASAPSLTSLYSCSGLAFTGSEVVYRVDQVLRGRLEAHLFGLAGRNQVLFLLRAGCSPVWDCVTGGADKFDIADLAAGTYYLVVDGATPADDGNFGLAITLRDTDCNRNGQNDRCDIANGSSQDCNRDGRPDDCRSCPVDLVFVMDTSGSMDPVAASLCSAIDATVATLATEGIDSTTFVWGITDKGFNQSYSCLTDTVVAQLGPSVPGPPTPPGNLSTLTNSEDWGLATAVVAGLFPWTPAAIRIVVPMSDEGALKGDPVNDPGDDRDAIDHAISVALANRVLVSPITPDAAPASVALLAQDLAAGTGGTWWRSGSVGGGIGEAIVDIARSGCIAVGSPADAGADRQICVGVRVTLDGSASSSRCAGNREYHWIENGAEVCGWSDVATCEVNPTASTTYTLEVRCSEAPQCIVSDTINVTVDPTLPPDLGNSLRAVRPSVSSVTITWAPAAGAETFNLYRGVQKGVWPPPFMTGVSTSVTLPDVPPPPGLYFYRVTGVSCGGLEGP